MCVYGMSSVRPFVLEGLQPAPGVFTLTTPHVEDRVVVSQVVRNDPMLDSVECDRCQEGTTRQGCVCGCVFVHGAGPLQV